MDGKFVSFYAGFGSWFLEASFNGLFTYSVTIPINGNRERALEGLASWLFDHEITVYGCVKIDSPNKDLSLLDKKEAKYLFDRTCELRDR